MTAAAARRKEAARALSLTYDGIPVVGDGAEWDGDAEWPALLRRADRLSPGFRD